MKNTNLSIEHDSYGYYIIINHYKYIDSPQSDVDLIKYLKITQEKFDKLIDKYDHFFSTTNIGEFHYLCTYFRNKKEINEFINILKPYEIMSILEGI